MLIHFALEFFRSTQITYKKQLVRGQFSFSQLTMWFIFSLTACFTKSLSGQKDNQPEGNCFVFVFANNQCPCRVLALRFQILSHKQIQKVTPRFQ